MQGCAPAMGDAELGALVCKLALFQEGIAAEEHDIQHDARAPDVHRIGLAQTHQDLRGCVIHHKDSQLLGA